MSTKDERTARHDGEGVSERKILWGDIGDEVSRIVNPLTFINEFSCDLTDILREARLSL